MLQRKNIRLKNFDYTQTGAYFITICTANKKCTLSQIRRGDPRGRQTHSRPKIILTELGKICEQAIVKTENIFNIKIEQYVIMPNHLHLIIFLHKPQTIQATARVATTIGTVVGGFKSLAANEWLKICKGKNIKMGDIWQRNYYDHVIRNQNDYLIHYNYIENNPLKWEDDDYYI